MGLRARGLLLGGGEPVARQGQARRPALRPALPAGPHPDRAGPRHCVEPGALGRPDERARDRRPDRRALPDLALHLQQRQSDRLLRRGHARAARARRARVRPGRRRTPRCARWSSSGTARAGCSRSSPSVDSGLALLARCHRRPARPARARRRDVRRRCAARSIFTPRAVREARDLRVHAAARQLPGGDEPRGHRRLAHRAAERPDQAGRRRRRGSREDRAAQLDAACRPASTT